MGTLTSLKELIDWEHNVVEKHNMYLNTIDSLKNKIHWTKVSPEETYRLEVALEEATEHANNLRAEFKRYRKDIKEALHEDNWR